MAEATTQTVEGRERCNVAIRYPAALRFDPDDVAREVQVARAGRVFTCANPSADIMMRVVDRVRSKMMTEVAIEAGLMPIFWAHGIGSEIMSRIDVPVTGGIASSTLLALTAVRRSLRR